MGKSATADSRKRKSEKNDKSGDEKMSPRRVELMQMMFNHFDINHDSKLDIKEMREWAINTGFVGTEREWMEEYKLLCSEARPPCKPEDGIHIHSFISLVNNEFGVGCHCSTEELEQLAITHCKKPENPLQLVIGQPATEASAGSV